MPGVYSSRDQSASGRTLQGKLSQARAGDTFRESQWNVWSVLSSSKPDRRSVLAQTPKGLQLGNSSGHDERLPSHLAFLVQTQKLPVLETEPF